MSFEWHSTTLLDRSYIASQSCLTGNKNLEEILRSEPSLAEGLTSTVSIDLIWTIFYVKILGFSGGASLNESSIVVHLDLRKRISDLSQFPEYPTSLRWIDCLADRSTYS